MVVRVYIASVSSNKGIKGQQQKIFMLLQSKKIEFEEVDICESAEKKEDMRRVSGNPTQLAPYISNDDEPCGDYEAFDLAVEDEKMYEFLKLPTPAKGD